MLGCASYTTNLAVKDLIGLLEISNLFKLIVEVIKYFKSSAILVGLINKAAGNLKEKRYALQLPGKTRWQGKLYATESLLVNKHLM